MNKAEQDFYNAYGKLLDAQLEAAETEAADAPFDCSPRFEKRMAKLIKAAGSGKSAARRGRRLLIAAAALLLLTATACAVPKVRSTIAGIFIQTFGSHVDLTDLSATRESIEKVYGLVPAPEGLEESIAARTHTSVTTIYSDESGVVIQFRQLANPHASIAVDNERGELSEHVFGDKKVLVYLSDISMTASWIEDGYYFQIDHFSSSDLELLEELVASVTPK